MTARSITEVKREALRAMRDQRERGVSAATLRRLGAAQPSALVQELRMRGYEIEELEDLDRGGHRYRLVTDARITGMRRKKAQMRFGDPA